MSSAIGHWRFSAPHRHGCKAASVGGLASLSDAPVRIIVAAAAGGAANIQARLFGQWLSDRLGQQFIVDKSTGCRQQC